MTGMRGMRWECGCGESAFFTNNKKLYDGFLTLTTQPGFYLFKINNRNTKNTRERCEICLKLTVRKLERRQ